MILPISYAAGLAILVVSLLCWGSWANTLKRSGKWRYELYYFDFAFGFLLFAVIAAFTFGSLKSNELTFQDNFLITGYRKMAYAVGAGIVFNLANLLLTAAVASGGMAVAFSLALGVAAIIGVVWDFAANPEGNAILLFGGAVVVLIAVVVMGFAYAGYKEFLLEAKKKAAALQLDPRSKGKKRTTSSGAPLAIALAIVSGIIFGFFPPVVQLAVEGDNGVAAYGTTLLIAVGVLVSTVIASPFTINFPATGTPARIVDYFRGGAAQHLLGILGGILLCGGLLGGLVIAGSPAAGQVGPFWLYALSHGAPLIAILWGLLVWHEFDGAGDRVRNLLLASAVLYAIGVGVIAAAPAYVSR